MNATPSRSRDNAWTAASVNCSQPLFWCEPACRSRTVNVEVRVKRTYVKRDVLEQQAKAQQDEIDAKKREAEDAVRLERERLERRVPARVLVAIEQLGCVYGAGCASIGTTCTGRKQIVSFSVLLAGAGVVVLSL